MEGDGRCVADNPAWWRRARELVFLQGDGAGEVEGSGILKVDGVWSMVRMVKTS